MGKMHFKLLMMNNLIHRFNQKYSVLRSAKIVILKKEAVGKRSLSINYGI